MMLATPSGFRPRRWDWRAGSVGSRLVLTHSLASGPATPDFAAGWHRALASERAR